MYRTILVSGCALLVSITAALAQSTRTVTRTFPLPRDGQFSLDTYKGSYTIRAWDKAEAAIEARIVADDDQSHDGDRNVVDLVDIDMEASERSVSVRSDYRRVERERRGWAFWRSGHVSHPFVHYTISIPATVRLRVDDYKSEDALIEDMTGAVSLETYKGSVRLRNFTGELRGETYKGTVEVEYAQMRSDARVETYKGEFRLSIPRSTPFSVRGTLGHRADLRTDFDIDERGGRRSRDDRRLAASINGGGPELAIESEKGTIRIEAR